MENALDYEGGTQLMYQESTMQESTMYVDTIQALPYDLAITSTGDAIVEPTRLWGLLQRQSDSFDLTHRTKDGRRDTFIIGRNDVCDISVADKRVSSKHCLIYCDYSQARLRIFLEDSSQNGTFINNSLSRLNKGERVELKTGDEIYLFNPRNMKTAEDRLASFMFKNIRERMLGQRQIERAPVSAVQPSEARHVEDVYIIGDQIGAGMCGTVHVCVDIATGVQRAVKIIDTKKFALNPGLSPSDLREEAEMMRALDHPNIIRIIDTFETDNILFIVMELVRGGDLFDRIVERGRYSEDSARAVMKRVLSAVSYLHSKDIIHRDLKPENILLLDPSDDTEIKITDFGLAKRTNQEGLKTFCGTPQYFAPEVLKRKSSVARTGRYGTSADMWSLGVVLYILLSGSFPFDEDNLFDQIQHAHYSLTGPEWASVSDSAKHLVRSLMKLRPEERVLVQDALQHPWITGDTFPDHASRKESIRKLVTTQRTAVSSVMRTATRVKTQNDQSRSSNGSRAANTKVHEVNSDVKPLAFWSKSLSAKRSQNGSFSGSMVTGDGKVAEMCTTVQPLSLFGRATSSGTLEHGGEAIASILSVTAFRHGAVTPKTSSQLHESVSTSPKGVAKRPKAAKPFPAASQASAPTSTCRSAAKSKSSASRPPSSAKQKKLPKPLGGMDFELLDTRELSDDCIEDFSAEGSEDEEEDDPTDRKGNQAGSGKMQIGSVVSDAVEVAIAGGSRGERGIVVAADAATDAAVVAPSGPTQPTTDKKPAVPASKSKRKATKASTPTPKLIGRGSLESAWGIGVLPLHDYKRPRRTEHENVPNSQSQVLEETTISSKMPRLA